ncbi:prepilin-type N-terminal cleavage/methylation domain-containing protein, partial [Aeromonas hydrophila]
MMNYVNQNNEIMASKKQGGFTLIEFSIVVAIAAVLLVVVLQVAEGVKYQTKQEALIKQMQQITTATERWKKGRPNKNGVSMSVLCATG